MKLAFWIWLGCSVSGNGDFDSSHKVTCNTGGIDSVNGSNCYLQPRSDYVQKLVSAQVNPSVPKRKTTTPGKRNRRKNNNKRKKNKKRNPTKPQYEVIQPPSYDTSKPLSGVSYSALTTGDCKSQEQVNKDIKLISTYTSNVRLYGSDCDQLGLVANAILSQKLSVKILMGIWTRDGPERRDKETQSVIQVLNTNPAAVSLLSGITVGNEEIFNGRSVGDVASDIAAVKSKLQASNINSPVSTVEVGHLWTKELAEHSATIYANLYSFFSPSPDGNPSMNTAAKDVFDQVDTLKSRIGTSKPIIIAETGWPSEGTTSAPHYAPPSSTTQSDFMASLMCLGTRRNIPYYVMEAFDAKWKTGESVEQHFGLFNDQGQPKFQLRSLQQC